MKLAVDMAKTKFAGDTPPPMKEKDGGVTKHSGSEKITINEADGGGLTSIEGFSQSPAAAYLSVMVRHEVV